MLITLKQRFEIKLLDKPTDESNGMIEGKLTVDFFSTRPIDSRAIEKERIGNWKT